MEVIDTEHRLVIARGGVGGYGGGEKAEGNQKVQTSRYKMKSGDVTYCVVFQLILLNYILGKKRNVAGSKNENVYLR